MSELSERTENLFSSFLAEAILAARGFPANGSPAMMSFRERLSTLEAERTALIAHVIAYGKTEAVRWPDELEETYQALSPELRAEIEATDE